MGGIEEFKTVQETASILRCSEDHVYRALDSEMFPGAFRQLSSDGKGRKGSWLIPVSGIEAYLQRARGVAAK